MHSVRRRKKKIKLKTKVCMREYICMWGIRRGLSERAEAESARIGVVFQFRAKKCSFVPPLFSLRFQHFGPLLVLSCFHTGLILEKSSSSSGSEQQLRRPHVTPNKRLDISVVFDRIEQNGR